MLLGYYAVPIYYYIEWTVYNVTVQWYAQTTIVVINNMLWSNTQHV